MEDEIKTRLLQSISDDRLVVICGAGLSMAPPSSLPSAISVANTCHDRQLIINNNFDMSIRNDIEAIASHFQDQGELVSHFIRHLVPWGDFLCPPNNGHKALSDFLICKAVRSVLSTNYDELVEEPAKKNGADLQVAINGDEADLHLANHSPLIKIHGCQSRLRDETIWVNSQIDSTESISARIDNITRWMNVNLREKDLLVIGFWTDWSYLNTIFQNTFENVAPHSVTIIDPSDSLVLKGKAPKLWDLFNGENIVFSHVRESGADFLDVLRKEYSKMYLRGVFRYGADAIRDEFNITYDISWLELPDMESEEYCQWRRDAECLGYKKSPRNKTPTPDSVFGYMHLLMRKEGAVPNAMGYEFNGKIVKLVNGSGKFTKDVRELYSQAPIANDVDINICVGSTSFGLPEHIIKSKQGNDIIRSESCGLFVDHSEAKNILGI